MTPRWLQDAPKWLAVSEKGRNKTVHGASETFSRLLGVESWPAVSGKGLHNTAHGFMETFSRLIGVEILPAVSEQGLHKTAHVFMETFSRLFGVEIWPGRNMARSNWTELPERGGTFHHRDCECGGAALLFSRVVWT